MISPRHDQTGKLPSKLAAGTEARQSRDVLDALALNEAITSPSAESPAGFLEGVRAECRHTSFPEASKFSCSAV